MDCRHPLVHVIDDDDGTRELYRLLLESVGYRVEDVSRLAGIGALLTRSVPHVVLSDWLLPDGDGAAVCRALDAEPATRHVPVVIATGLVHEGVRAAVRHHPHRTVEVLEKPVYPETLLRTLRRVLLTDAECRVRRAAERTRRLAERVRRLATGGSPFDPDVLIARAVARSDASVSLLIADDEGHCIAAGGATRELTGYDPRELKNLSLWDLMPPFGEGAAGGRHVIPSGMQQGRSLLRHRDGRTVETDYCAIANIAPGLHVSALAETAQVPSSLG